MNDINPLGHECCICGGRTTFYTTSSAHITVENKEYRVFYHSACLSEQTKPIITKMLQDMTKE